jgi:hypothetical protein
MSTEAVPFFQEHIKRHLAKREVAMTAQDALEVLAETRAIDALYNLLSEFTTMQYTDHPMTRREVDKFLAAHIRRVVTAGVDTQKSGFEIRLRIVEIAERMVGDTFDDRLSAVLTIARKLNQFVSSRSGDGEHKPSTPGESEPYLDDKGYWRHRGEGQ